MLDVQECPSADLAIAAAVAEVLRALCDPAPAHQARLRALATPRLARVLDATTAQAGEALVADGELLRALGLDASARPAREVWRALVARHVAGGAGWAEHRPALEVILEEGSLARRILERTGPRPDRSALAAAYHELADCLRQGRLFRAGC